MAFCKPVTVSPRDSDMEQVGGVGSFLRKAGKFSEDWVDPTKRTGGTHWLGGWVETTGTYCLEVWVDQAKGAGGKRNIMPGQNCNNLRLFRHFKFRYKASLVPALCKHEVVTSTYRR